MQVSVESTEGLQRRIKVQLPAERVNDAVEKRLKQLARTVRLDGFRPGKVPLSVVRRRFAGQARQEVFGDLVQSTYFEALAQEKLQPAGDPRIEAMDIPPEEGLGYIATIEVMPDVALGDLGGVVINRPKVVVTDADLEAMIQKLRRQRMTWEEVDRAAADGDRLTINFKGFIDGEAFEGGTAEGVPLELGSNAMIEGFESGLVGAKAGEQRTLELQFPGDYRVEKLAGKAATFEVAVVKVAEPRLPEVDEAFARAFGVTEGGVDEFYAEIRENMERELAEKISGMVKEQAMNALIEAHPMDVPAALVKQEAESLLKQAKANMAQAGQSSTMELPASIFEDQARRRVSLGLIIAEVIRANGIEVDEERVRSKVEEFAQTYEKPQEVVDYYYANKEQLTGIQNLVLEDQVVDWVLEQAQVEEKEAGFDEVMNPKPGSAGTAE